MQDRITEYNELTQLSLMTHLVSVCHTVPEAQFKHSVENISIKLQFKDKRTDNQGQRPKE